jgi:hypothetical protein
LLLFNNSIHMLFACDCYSPVSQQNILMTGKKVTSLTDTK